MFANRSDWCALSKGTPQVSILGPYLFNTFINADDNKDGMSGKSGDEVCLNLKNLRHDILPCLTENFVEVNPSKFKFMVFSFR